MEAAPALVSSFRIDRFKYGFGLMGVSNYYFILVFLFMLRRWDVRVYDVGFLMFRLFGFYGC
jgi:hypothetical protein